MFQYSLTGKDGSGSGKDGSGSGFGSWENGSGGSGSAFGFGENGSDGSGSVPEPRPTLEEKQPQVQPMQGILAILAEDSRANQNTQPLGLV